MIFSKKISTSIEAVKHNIQNKFDSERIQMVEISKLSYDKDFKELFMQEPDKVERIAEDIKKRGYDKSQPIIATKDFKILDGHSRFLACQQCGIKYVPVVFKEFLNKTEALIYELHLQVDRRNITDAMSLKMFQKLEELKNNAKEQGASIEDYSDSKIAEQLKKSERQVQKIREVTKKASKETLGKISEGTISINQAYSQIKNTEKSENKLTQKLNPTEFCKGVRFALDEIAKGKTAEEILSTL